MRDPSSEWCDACKDGMKGAVCKDCGIELCKPCSYIHLCDYKWKAISLVKNTKKAT